MNKNDKSIINTLLSTLIFLGFYVTSFGNSYFLNKDINPVSELDSGIVKGIKYKFYEKENYYSFIGEFIINVDYDCLINVSFDVEHKKKYNKNVSSITLMKREKDKYIVKFIIEKLLIVKNTSYWLLMLHPEKNMITYKMLSNKSNMKLYDVIKRSQGYYKFIALKTGFKVIYLQETFLEPGFLMKPYRSLAKDEAIKFMVDYRKYLKKTCN